jgi:acyl-coenzyme A thioesterase PaaI-like protein|tara:strand:- start:1126 stop:1602 length:477 start_codon:yes stop_codon:yes gene_type:complete
MRNDDSLSVQEKYAPNSICFGCGPANKKGLQIKSFRTEKGLEMIFETSIEHQAFPGIINGGIISTLLDCHGNWAATMALMDQSNNDVPPCTVTASFSMKLKRPTPINTKLEVSANIENISEDRVNVNMILVADGKVCATGKGLFVAVKEGHPAYHRWN